MIEQLDHSYLNVIETNATSFSQSYAGIVGHGNYARKDIAKQFGVTYKPLEIINQAPIDQIKTEYIDFFKHIINRVKAGESPENMKGISLSNNQYIKSLKDIKNVEKAAVQSFKITTDIQNARMHHQFYKKSDDETFADISESIKKSINEMSKIEPNAFLKQYLAKVWNLDILLHEVHSKLYK